MYEKNKQLSAMILLASACSTSSPIASVEPSCEQRFIVHFYGDVDLEAGKSQLINQIGSSSYPSDTSYANK
jgi:hypothetical protein